MKHGRRTTASYGLRLSDLCSSEAVQLSIFEPEEWLKQKQLDSVIDKIRLNTEPIK